MSTMDCRIADDSKFFEVCFSKAHPDMSQEVSKLIETEIMKTGEIQIETLIENALEAVGGPKKNSTFGMDFEDGSDAKKSCVGICSMGRLYAGHVTRIITKVGSLRVMMYERIQDKFYYFFIPKESYYGYKLIEIPFTFSGEPKRKNKWWKYEVSSFEEMATTGKE